MIIKLAMLLQFTNPSKLSTFNNSTNSFSGKRINKLVKFFYQLSLIFSSILLRMIPNSAADLVETGTIVFEL